MKVNYIPALIAVAISLLITYGMYSFHSGENKILISCGSGLVSAITLLMTIGVSFELPRTEINVRTVSGVFFVIGLIENIIFLFLNFSTPMYVITTGILMSVYILIAYQITMAKQ